MIILDQRGRRCPLPIGPLVLTEPVSGSRVVQPWTDAPVAVNMLPFLSAWKLPARVYWVLPALSRRTKNPSPWIEASRTPELVWTAPWVNCRTVSG